MYGNNRTLVTTVAAYAVKLPLAGLGLGVAVLFAVAMMGVLGFWMAVGWAFTSQIAAFALTSLGASAATTKQVSAVAGAAVWGLLVLGFLSPVLKVP